MFSDLARARTFSLSQKSKWMVGGFLGELLIPPPLKADSHEIAQ